MEKRYNLPSGSILIISEEGSLFVRATPTSIPLTTDERDVFDEVIELVDSLKTNAAILKSNVDYWEAIAKRLADAVEANKKKWDVFQCDDCGQRYAIDQIEDDEIDEPTCPACGCDYSNIIEEPI